MFGTLLGYVGKIFGIGSGGSLLNNVAGVADHAAAGALLIYLANNANKQIQFETSYAFLALVVAIAYLVLEVVRRHAPGAA